MIDVLNLLWIVPASMVIGAVAIIVIACAVRAGDISQEEEKNDNRKA